MSIFEVLVTGATFGVAAGITPGPLFSLMVSQTLLYGRNEGLKISIVPILSDLPIILLSFIIIKMASSFSLFIALISLSGAVYMLFLAYKNISLSLKNINFSSKEKPQSIKTGLIINILSPYPYMFWLTVGAPLIYFKQSGSISSAIAFTVSFYGVMCFSKLVIVLLLSHSREKFKINNMRVLYFILGLLMLYFSFTFFKNGFGYL